MTRFICAALLTGVLTLANASNGDISKVNGSIRVTAEEPAGDVSTVNGSIHIEDGGRAEDVETVNGSISIGADAVVGSIETVNGRVSFGEARVQRRWTPSTDPLNSCGQDAGQRTRRHGQWRRATRAERERGRRRNQRQRQDLARSCAGRRRAAHDQWRHRGRRRLPRRRRILVEKPNASWFWRKQRVPQIVIGPGAVVEGTLKFEREVELYVSESAKIGAVEGAKPVMFSGDEPGRTADRAAEPQVEK